MKKGITVYTEYDKLGRWTLIIEKEKRQADAAGNHGCGAGT